ncbi:hypothetical protein DY000_02039913 [Brassica cretica]|uniref:Retrotransposon gag domain-containing protein n=1 Tax=Brassica cretica TaxID=69181 RepID=A0ABQ7BIU1_BRACR|nr:hypothetical protein DY000_02039913 [Brassica cretica]
MSRTTYPKLLQEKQSSKGNSTSLKEKLEEHSKHLEQSGEKLIQLESENLNLRDENQALNTASTTPPPTTSQGDAATREKAKGAQTYDVEDSESEPKPDKEAPDGTEKNGVSYGCLPGADVLQEARRHAVHGRKAPREMPRKFSFPNIKAYDGTSDPNDHVAQYRQKMLAVALPKESREATMCKGFGSTLTGPALQWYINLPYKSIASFVILSDKFVEQFASSRDLEKTSDGLYEILQHRAEPL